MSALRCQCEDCSPQAPGLTYTRRFIAECEARWVAGMSDYRRDLYIDAVRQARGPEAAERLYEDAYRIVDRRAT